MRSLLALLLVLACALPAFADQYVPPSLCGSWAYVSRDSGDADGRVLTLRADGTYEYRFPTSSSDTGTWWSQNGLLFFDSRSEGVTQFPLRLMNHPKTGDAMLVLAGDWYVATDRREPWSGR